MPENQILNIQNPNKAKHDCEGLYSQDTFNEIAGRDRRIPEVHGTPSLEYTIIINKTHFLKQDGRLGQAAKVGCLPLLTDKNIQTHIHMYKHT